MNTDNGRDDYIKKIPDLMKKYHKVEVQLSEDMRKITRKVCSVSQFRKFPGDWGYTCGTADC